MWSCRSCAAASVACALTRRSGRNRRRWPGDVQAGTTFEEDFHGPPAVSEGGVAAATPRMKSDTAARARRDRRRQRMMPENGADRSVGRDWITQSPSASQRPPGTEMERHPSRTSAPPFPRYDGARPRAADLLAKSPDGLAGHLTAGNRAGVDNPEPHIASKRLSNYSTTTRMAQTALAPG